MFLVRSWGILKNYPLKEIPEGESLKRRVSFPKRESFLFTMMQNYKLLLKNIIVSVFFSIFKINVRIIIIILS